MGGKYFSLSRRVYVAANSIESHGGTPIVNYISILTFLVNLINYMLQPEAQADYYEEDSKSR